MLENNRRWRCENSARARARDKKYRAKYAAKRKKQWKAWYAKNRDRVLAKAKERAKELDPAARNARVREQYARDPSRFLVDMNNRRARKKAASGRVTKADWRAVLDEHGRHCAYCGRSDRPLTMDHLIPLSRGGPHAKSNIVPACKPCNSSKRTRTPLEYFWKTA